MANIEFLCKCPYGPEYVLNTTFSCAATDKMATCYEGLIVGVALMNATEIVEQLRSMYGSSDCSMDRGVKRTGHTTLYVIIAGTAGGTAIVLTVLVAGMLMGGACYRWRRNRKTMRLSSFR